VRECVPYLFHAIQKFIEEFSPEGLELCYCHRNWNKQLK
jgi:hypothetical protein